MTEANGAPETRTYRGWLRVLNSEGGLGRPTAPTNFFYCLSWRQSEPELSEKERSFCHHIPVRVTIEKAES